MQSLNMLNKYNLPCVVCGRPLEGANVGTESDSSVTKVVGTRTGFSQSNEMRLTCPVGHKYFVSERQIDLSILHYLPEVLERLGGDDKLIGFSLDNLPQYTSTAYTVSYGAVTRIRTGVRNFISPKKQYMDNITLYLCVEFRKMTVIFAGSRLQEGRQSFTDMILDYEVI